MAHSSIDLPAPVIGKKVRLTPFLTYLRENGINDVPTAPLKSLKAVLDAFNRFVYGKLSDFTFEQAEKNPNSEYADSAANFYSYNEWLNSVKENLYIIKSGRIPGNFWKPERHYLADTQYATAMLRVADEDTRYQYTGNQIRAGLNNIATKVNTHGKNVRNGLAFAGVMIASSVKLAGKDISGRNPY